MAEEFLDKCLSKLKVRLNHVIHLGAEWAQEHDTYQKFGAKSVYWVDPVPYNKQVAFSHFIRNSTMQNVWIDRAISDKDFAILDFHIYNHGSASSLFAPKDMNKYYPEHKIKETIRVQGFKLDTMIDLWRINPFAVTLLSMDIQGAELMAIKHGHNLLKCPALEHICVEVVWEDLYDGGCLKVDIDNVLREYGFKEVFFQQHEPTYPGIESVPQADIFYTRNLSWT